MNLRLKGSELTRAMLKRGDHDIWCAIDDDSDEQAMTDHTNNDFTTRIVSFNKGQFICSGGMSWTFAVPVMLVAVTQAEVGL